MKDLIVKGVSVGKRLVCFILLFIYGSFCGTLFAGPGKEDLKLKKPYRISGQIIEENDESFQFERKGRYALEISIKNKSRKTITCFTVLVYVSLFEDEESTSYAGFDEDYDFGRSDFADGLNQFVFRVEEEVGGDERGVFIFPLELEAFSDYLSDDYRDIRYEIDFIYVSEIEYEDGEKWFYKGGS